MGFLKNTTYQVRRQLATAACLGPSLGLRGKKGGSMNCQIWPIMEPMTMKSVTIG